MSLFVNHTQKKSSCHITVSLCFLVNTRCNHCFMQITCRHTVITPLHSF
ncbi:hypothetical protein [Escherichia phage dw-ec]|nr:hypothetical protein [Escherichia phage BI-EHEC]UJQ43829.1 hypothetical protein [Escherichia phage dw-ec]